MKSGAKFFSELAQLELQLADAAKRRVMVMQQLAELQARLDRLSGFIRMMEEERLQGELEA